LVTILSVAEEVVKLGGRLGADEVEAYVISADSKKVALTGRSWTLNTSCSNGLGVRVMIGKKTGFFATSSLEIGDAKSAVRKAYSIAKLSEPDVEWVSLPTKSGQADVEQTFDREIAEIEPDRLVLLVTQMKDTVEDCGKSLSITRGEISFETVETAIRNSDNCNLCRKGTFASAVLSVKAEKSGSKGISSESQQVRTLKKLDCSFLAKTAAERASRIVYAERIPNEKMPVVWRNKVFASALRTMFRRTLCADSIQKGRSPWIGKVGERIASQNFNLVDNGLMKGGIRTREFDDEGTKQQRVLLIDRGILQGFLYDSYTANKDHCESTGNSSRSYRSLPAPTPNNLFLKPGRVKNEELVKDVKRGLFLFEEIGVWLSNPISGDLSATATNAFLVEKGELTKPVKGVIISGNFFEMMQNKIDLVADDVQNLGSTYSPSIRVSEMTVTG
jgi:PmbA protein